MQYKRLEEIKDEEIEDQIKIRADMANQMLGDLYKTMLVNEISALFDRKNERSMVQMVDGD